jgi:hypothetical protein
MIFFMKQEGFPPTDYIDLNKRKYKANIQCEGEKPTMKKNQDKLSSHWDIKIAR